jgi:hypothetical protein
MEFYSNPRFRFDALMRQCRKQSPKGKNVPQSEAFRAALDGAMLLGDNASKASFAGDVRIMMEEWRVRTEGTMYFPSNEKLLQGLLKSNISVDDELLPDMLPSTNSVVINFPRKFKIDGEHVMGALVNVRKQGNETHAQNFCDAMKLSNSESSELIDVMYKRPLPNIKNDDTILSIVLYRKNDDNLIFHGTPVSIAKSMQIDTQDWAVKYYSLVMKFLIYCNSFPNNVHNQIPHKKGGARNYARVTEETVVGEDGKLISPVYVGWTLRQLRAECYYQGEYADMPRGSRFTYVKPHVRRSLNSNVEVTLKK